MNEKPMKEKQEILDELVHMLKTVGPAIGQLGRCAYKVKNNNHPGCAVGRCLAIYSPEFEDSDVLDLNCDLVNMGYGNGLEDVLKEEYRGHEIEFWVKLQNIHDNWKSPYEYCIKSFNSALNYLSEYYGLNTSGIKPLKIEES